MVCPNYINCATLALFLVRSLTAVVFSVLVKCIAIWSALLSYWLGFSFPSDRNLFPSDQCLGSSQYLEYFAIDTQIDSKRSISMLDLFKAKPLPDARSQYASIFALSQSQSTHTFICTCFGQSNWPRFELSQLEPSSRDVTARTANKT